jgi:uracil phosphoribosyltransferase
MQSNERFQEGIPMNNVFIFDHPLIQHKVSLLRDKNTSAKEFRELASEISMLMGYEVTRDIPLKEVEIETPIGLAKTKVISGKKLAFVPILRAGLAWWTDFCSWCPWPELVISAFIEIMIPLNLLILL